VLNLHRAALENRRGELIAQVLGFSVAVNNTLDLALGGKGMILDNWLKATDTPAEEATEKKRCCTLSPGARDFFGGAPVVVKKR
jgi:hypothetical protein